MKYGSIFVHEPNAARMSEFSIDNYTLDQMMTCDHLNIAELFNLFDEHSLNYCIEPPLLESDSFLVIEVTAESLNHIFQNKTFFSEQYQPDLEALEKFHKLCGGSNLYEVAVW